jgi:hypothetical protein
MGIDESKEVVFPAFTVGEWKRIPSRSELKLERKSAVQIGITYSTWLTTHSIGTATIRSATPGILADRYVLDVEGCEVTVDVRKGTIGKEPIEGYTNAPSLS